MDSLEGGKPVRDAPWNCAPPQSGKDLSALYGQPSHCSRIEKESRELQEVLPGPGHFFGPESKCFNSVGPSLLSNSRSAPVISIPKTGWDNWRNALITVNHKNKAEEGPEPGRYNFELSTLSQKGISVARDKRFHKRSSITPSPGPVYDIREQHYKDGKTDVLGNHAARFNNAQRFTRNMGESNVAPGQYDRKDTAIRVDFARGKSFGIGRKAYDKVLRPGTQSEAQGKTSPGVGPPLWEEPDTYGKQHLIPKAKRFRGGGSSKPEPGPGAYARDERDLSRLKSAISDTRNPQGCKFGKPMTKPRLRMHLLSQCKDGNWGYM
eukprot:GEMP01057761.1.p1 GENE.GEMP01057761.1~~GEMP01057761.1.p1  ORF type:complete len:330 (+),score=49.87 GEMP01057761.1:25-990(+)